MMWEWRLYPSIVRRKADSTVWAAIGDCPIPFDGYNFVRAEKAWLGWWVNPFDRWVSRNPEKFEIISCG